MLCSNQLSYVAKWRALFASRGCVSTLLVRFFCLLFQMLMPPVPWLAGCCRSIPFGREVGIGQAFVAVQRGDLLHLFFGQAQLLRREVGGEVFALGGGGNHGEALLQQPGEGDLCRAGVVAFAER